MLTNSDNYQNGLTSFLTHRARQIKVKVVLTKFNSMHNGIGISVLLNNFVR